MSVNFTILANGVEYPYVSIFGKNKDMNWDDRDSKYITLKMAPADVFEIFKDGLRWSIIERGFKSVVAANEDGTVQYDENGNLVMIKTDEYCREHDNSEYCILGDIVFHPDGTCTVAMGKPTEAERMQEQLANTVTGEELAAAYNEGVNSL